jgi:Ni/Fe-hydrogenase subunit HybB-like protein
MDRSNFSPSCGRTDPDLPSQRLEDTEAALAIEQIELKAIHQLCRHHKDRAAAWLAGLFVSLPVSVMSASGAVSSTAWGTWLINWQSNLILYFAGLCLVMCLGHSARRVHLTFSVKHPKDRW